MVWKGLIRRCIVGVSVLVVLPLVAVASVVFGLLTTGLWVLFDGDITHATFDCDDELE